MSLAKQAAREARGLRGLVRGRGGFVTEGASTNAWIVTPRRRAGHPPGRRRRSCAASTRATLIDVAAREGLRLEERPFSLAEALGAREAFFSSATTIAMPVVAIDGRAIGDGRPGPITLTLRKRFHEIAAKT